MSNLDKSNWLDLCLDFRQFDEKILFVFLKWNVYNVYISGRKVFDEYNVQSKILQVLILDEWKMMMDLNIIYASTLLHWIFLFIFLM